ncbi:uncharacterized protein TNCV_3661181 [Trichonephila clavipes]|nr:uncharacterized protein TNCV_3661181 [Trichonephila clavipes]
MLNSCVMHRHAGPATGNMAWGGIGYHSHTPLGLATAIFQHNNARLHVTRIVQRFFVNHQIELLPRPARSPNRSPMENKCSMVAAQRLTQITPPAANRSTLATEEAHFWLNGYVNKQNCRIWSEANPQVYVETPLHPEKLTIWCALWAGGIIGPYFFKNDEGHNVTVNGDRYRAMITNFFIPELNNHDVQELWFQQDGATCHTARAAIDLLKDTFGDRLISRFGPVNWPPRSCDLTPLDYFLWGYVKSLVYADKPQTLDHLEDNIHPELLPIYGHKCWKKSSKIGRPDWTTSEPAVAVLCQK